MNLLREVLSQAWVNGMLGLIGVVLSVIGVFMYFASRARSRLAAQINSLELAGLNSVLPDAIEFLFNGNKVPKVTLSRIAIWNTGNTTLRGDQIVESDPLRVVTSEGSEVLEATVLNATRSVNDFKVFYYPDHPNAIRCEFDYLDPLDGALIQIIHTGSERIEIVGTLRGIRKKVQVINVTRKEESKKADAGGGSASVMKIAGTMVVLIGIAVTLFSATTTDKKSVLIGGLLVSLGGLFYFSARFMPPKGLSTQITSMGGKKLTWPGWFSRKRVH